MAELDQDSTIRKFRTVALDDARYLERTKSRFDEFIDQAKKLMDRKQYDPHQSDPSKTTLHQLRLKNRLANPRLLFQNLQ